MIKTKRAKIYVIVGIIIFIVGFFIPIGLVFSWFRSMAVNESIANEGEVISDRYILYKGCIRTYSFSEFYSISQPFTCDRDNFTVIPDSSFSKDSANVFYFNQKIPGAKPETFTDLGNKFSHDTHTLYYGAKKIDVYNPENFKFIAPYEKYPWYLVLVVGNNVYLGATRITALDEDNTRPILGTSFLTDGKIVVLIGMEQSMKQDEANTYRYNESYYKVIKDVDASKFRIYSEYTVNKKAVCGDGVRFFNCENGFPIDKSKLKALEPTEYPY